MAISAQYPCKLKLIVFIGCILFPTPQEAFLTSPSLAYTAQKRLIPTDFDVKEPCPNKEWITEKWFPQKLDHFNSSDSRTYGQVSLHIRLTFSPKVKPLKRKHESLCCHIFSAISQTGSLASEYRRKMLPEILQYF